MRPQEITSPENEKIKKIKKLHTRRGRDQQKLILIEGENLITEALKAGLVFDSVMYREDSYSKYTDYWPELQNSNLATYLLPKTLFNSVVGTSSPQGIAATVRPPRTCYSYDELNISNDTGFYLILDGVQDPGNLGTIVRSAEASGVAAIFLGQGTVDLFNDKVIRAAAGSLFRIPFLQADAQEVITVLQRQHVTVLSTAVSGGQSLFKYSFPRKAAIILGNEANGVSRVLASMSDVKLSIPMVNKVESLNVAVTAAVVLYERLRQHI